MQIHCANKNTSIRLIQLKKLFAFIVNLGFLLINYFITKCVCIELEYKVTYYNINFACCIKKLTRSIQSVRKTNWNILSMYAGNVLFLL